MRLLFLSIFLIVNLLGAKDCKAQTGTFIWTNGAPTTNPGASGARFAVDRATFRWYEWVSGTTWVGSGDRIQGITGCSAPNYTPAIHQSWVVINNCDPNPELYAWNGTAWKLVEAGGGGGAIYTDETIAGDGAISTPLKIAQNGATNGQFLKWNGTAWKPYRDTIIVVSDGQSNSIGQGIPTPPKTYTFSSRLKVWNGSAFVAPVLGSAPFNPNGANNSALQFAQKLTEAFSTTLVLLIQTGNSGQPISYWLGGTGFNATNNAVTAAIGTKKADVFVWTQGESDYLRTADQYYADYYTLRNNWLGTTWYTPNTRHINVGLYIGAGSSLGFQDATLKKIGSDTIVQTSYANPYGLATYDNLHWNDESLTKIGGIIYNAYLATPYSYKISTATNGVNSNNVITKSNGSAFVNSRLSDDNTNLKFYDSTNKSTFLIESDKAATGIGDEPAEIRFSGRWGTAGSASGDLFNDATISLYKSTTFNNGGSSLKFSTSAFGGGGLTTQGYVDMDGHFDARVGFKIAGTAPNNAVLIGDGTSFKSLLPTSNYIQAWGGVRNDGIGVNNGVLLTSPTNSTGAVASSRLTFVNDVNAGLYLNGGNGANQGGFYMVQKGGSNVFAFGTQSSFLGGSTDNGIIYQYGANDFNFVNPNGTNLTVRSNGNIGINNTVPDEKLEVNGNIKTSGSITPGRWTTATRPTPTVNTNPIGFNTDLGSLENYDGTAWYAIPKIIKASATLNFPSTGAHSSSDLTVTVAGAAIRDGVVIHPDPAAIVANSCYTAWVSATNTVTVRYNHYGSGSSDPASNVFDLTIIKR